MWSLVYKLALAADDMHKALKPSRPAHLVDGEARSELTTADVKVELTPETAAFIEEDQIPSLHDEVPAIFSFDLYRSISRTQISRYGWTLLRADADLASFGETEAIDSDADVTGAPGPRTLPRTLAQKRRAAA